MCNRYCFPLSSLGLCNERGNVKDLVILSDSFGGICGEGFVPPVCEWLRGDHSPRRMHCMIHLEELGLGWSIVIGGCLRSILRWRGFYSFYFTLSCIAFLQLCVVDVAYRNRSGIL